MLTTSTVIHCLLFAMLLAASNVSDGSTEVVELLDIPDSVPNGELLSFDGKDIPEPDAMMKSKGALKAFERVKACLMVNSDGEASYVSEGTEHKMVSTGGPIKVGSLKNASIQ